MTRLLIVAHDLAENALGRAVVLGQLADELGLTWHIVGPRSGEVWPPVADGPMAGKVTALRGAGYGRNRLSGLVEELRPLLDDVDLVVPVKAHPESLGVAVTVAEERGLPVLADLDDPDHAALMGDLASVPQRVRYALRMLQRRRWPPAFTEVQELIPLVPKSVSNPTLRDMVNGGIVVPHARSVPSFIPPTPSDVLRVSFVGTPRRHKGLELLRRAVASLAPTAELVVTAEPPRDAMAHERWIGTTTLEMGREVIRRSDVVCAPSTPSGYAHAQLPAKVIDGMALGRVVIAAATGPVQWALADTGSLIEPGSLVDLVRALREAQMLGPAGRAALGRRAHRRATDVFSLERVAPTFLMAVQAAIASGPAPAAPHPLVGRRG